MELPPAALSAVLHYRDAVDPDAQADVEAIGNIALLIGAIIDQIEAWDGRLVEPRRHLRPALFDLLASNYVRREMPKWFLILQAIASAIELTETHGVGERGHTRFLNAFATIFAFIWNPGRTLDDLDDTRCQAPAGARSRPPVTNHFSSWTEQSGDWSLRSR